MISFIIITNAKKYETTIKSIDSIHKTMEGVQYEIIMVGDVEKFKSIADLKLINRPELAASGNLSAMRNCGAHYSQYDTLVFLDDDIIFSKDWFLNFKKYSDKNSFFVYANKVLLPDGGRYWDKAVIYKSYQSLVNYDHDEKDPNLYQSGAFMTIKKNIFDQIKFDENITYYSNSVDNKPKYNEDVNFSNRLYGAGYHISFDANNVVYHDDDRYVQVNHVVERRQLADQKSTSTAELSRYERIYRLYRDILKRRIDRGGLDSYLLQPLEISFIKNVLNNSEECNNLRKQDALKEQAHFFWHGKLTVFELKCIQSFVRHGFDVNVWSYQQHNNLPAGARLQDARKILPEDHLMKYQQISVFSEEGKNNKTYASLAAFSDAFRYTLLSKIEGWWFDCDCFCLKDQREFKQLRQNKNVIASCEKLEDDRYLGCGAIAVPNKALGSKLVKELNRRCLEHNYVFDRWGYIGPWLLTDVIDTEKLRHELLDHTAFYAISWKEMGLFLDPNLKQLAIKRTNDSYITHMWNSQLAEKFNIKSENPPTGSFLEWLFAK